MVNITLKQFIFAALVVAPIFTLAAPCNRGRQLPPPLIRPGGASSSSALSAQSHPRSADSLETRGTGPSKLITPGSVAAAGPTNIIEKLKAKGSRNPSSSSSKKKKKKQKKNPTDAPLIRQPVLGSALETTSGTSGQSQEPEQQPPTIPASIISSEGPSSLPARRASLPVQSSPRRQSASLMPHSQSEIAPPEGTATGRLRRVASSWDLGSEYSGRSSRRVQGSRDSTTANTAGATPQTNAWDDLEDMNFPRPPSRSAVAWWNAVDAYDEVPPRYEDRLKDAEISDTSLPSYTA